MSRTYSSEATAAAMPVVGTQPVAWANTPVGGCGERDDYLNTYRGPATDADPTDDRHPRGNAVALAAGLSGVAMAVVAVGVMLFGYTRPAQPAQVDVAPHSAPIAVQAPPAAPPAANTPAPVHRAPAPVHRVPAPAPLAPRAAAPAPAAPRAVPPPAAAPAAPPAEPPAAAPPAVPPQDGPGGPSVHFKKDGTMEIGTPDGGGFSLGPNGLGVKGPNGFDLCIETPAGINDQPVDPTNPGKSKC